MGRTRKVTDLDIGHWNIPDLKIRECFSRISDFVRRLVSDGLFTNGGVKCRFIEVADSGAFKISVFEGYLDSQSYRILQVPGLVLGAFGWGQYAAIANNSWEPIQGGFGSSATGGIRFSRAASYFGESDFVQIMNTHNANSAHYKVVVFYQDGDK